MFGSEGISAVTQRNGVPPNLLYRWRKLLLEGCSTTVAEDDGVTGKNALHEMENWISELERQLERKRWS